MENTITDHDALWGLFPKGTLVRTPVSGTGSPRDGIVGTITDRDTYAGYVLIRFDRGGEGLTDFDRTHGAWCAVIGLTVVGYDPDALVWRVTRMRPAGPHPGLGC